MQPATNDRNCKDAPTDREDLITMILGLTEEQCAMVIERFQKALAQSQL